VTLAGIRRTSVAATFAAQRPTAHGVWIPRPRLGRQAENVGEGESRDGSQIAQTETRGHVSPLVNRTSFW
jgi:hypothetical protein